VSDEIVELRDVMPTLLACAGVPVPEDVDGRDLRGVVSVRDAAPWTGQPAPAGERSAEAPSAVLAEDEPHLHGEHIALGHSMQWIRAGRWKYVWLSGSGVEQLFDLVVDPHELRDRSADAAAASALQACRARLIADLRGRPEGFVDGDALVPGRPVQPVLDQPHERVA